jgi:hypothetical protein
MALHLDLRREIEQRIVANLRADKTLGDLEVQPIFADDNHDQIVELVADEECSRRKLFLGERGTMLATPLYHSIAYEAVRGQMLRHHSRTAQGRE